MSRGRAPWSFALLLALAGSLLGATAASGAVDPSLPMCSSAATAAHWKLPAKLTVGREQRFGLSFDDVVLPEYQAEASVTFASVPPVTMPLAVKRDLSSFEMVLPDVSDAVPATVTVAWEDRDPAHSYDWCRSVLTRTVERVVGAAIAQPPRVDDWGDSVGFVLPQPSRCVERFAPTPVLLAVRRKAGRWATFTATDQCIGWDRPRSVNASFRISRVTSDELGFEPYTPDRTGVKVYEFRLSRARLVAGRLVAGATIQHAWLVTYTTRTPARRVYAWNGDQVNDEYWNYCVNRAKQTWMDHGNAYCVRPGSTTRETWLRKRLP